MNKESEGYRKIKDAILKDCNEGQGCFNENGCNHEFYRTEPQINQSLMDAGFTTCCKRISKCSHKYCDTFKWIIDRANHYAEKTGLKAEDILTAWEKERNYWYMNYYQDCNQPEIKSDNVRIFDTIDDLLKSIDKKEFRCPLCGGVSSDPSRCNTGIIVKNVKDNKDGPCNWAAYGLFGTMGKGIYIFVKEKISGQEIFMPIAWETKEDKA